MEISIVVINYNMPERADKLVEFVRAHTAMDYELTVVDNGSDKVPPSKYSSVWIPKNRDTLGGWFSGFHFSTGDLVWFLSTSTEFVETKVDILQEMTKHFDCDTVCVCSNWQGAKAVTHLRHGTAAEEAHEIKFVGPMAMWKRSWLKKNLPDARLTTGWGSDFELSYKLRLSGKKAMICPAVKMNVHEGIMYEMGRGRESNLDTRRDYARKQMDEVLTAKYGADWRVTLTEGTGIDPAKI